jgi:uncharacterized protein YjiS (DUF1127 family)
MPRAKARAFRDICGSATMAFHALRLWVAAIKGRRYLAGMDERMIADIGVSRSQAQHEMARRPWDIAPCGTGE